MTSEESADPTPTHHDEPVVLAAALAVCVTLSESTAAGLAGEIALRLHDLLDAAGAAIFLPDRQGSLTLAAAAGPSAPAVRRAWSGNLGAGAGGAGAAGDALPPTGLGDPVVVPLVARGRVVGLLAAIGVASLAAAAGRAQAFAALLGGPVERFLLGAELSAAAQAAAQPADLESTLAAILAGVRRFVPADAAGVLVPEGDEVRVIAVDGHPADATGYLLPVAGNPSIEDPLLHRRPIRQADLAHDAGSAVAPGVERIRGHLGVPLMAGDEVVGVLCADSWQADAFDDEDLRRACSFAVHAGAALAKAREHARARAEATALREAAALATRDPRAGDILPRILDGLRRVVTYDGATILLRVGDMVCVAAGHGQSRDLVGTCLPIAGSPSLEAPLLTGRAYVTADLLQEPGAQPLLGGRAVRGHLSAPLIARGEVMGLLAVDSLHSGAFRPDDVATVELFAGYVAAALLNARDSADREKMEEALRRSEWSFRQLFTCSPQPMWVYDVETLRFVEVNEAAVARYGYPRDELLAMTIAAIHLPDDVPRLLRHRGDSPYRDGAVWPHLLKDGRVIEAEVHAHDLEFVGRRVRLVMATDVTERRKAEAALQHQALHDALTGLPNRLLLHDRLEQALQAARRDGGCVALLLMDLDRFKEVNDTLGHHCGDLLLQAVGVRVRGALRTSDTVARLGGDEFAIVLPGLSDARGAMQAARSLLDILASPVVVDGHSLDVRPSIGIALFPEHGEAAGPLLRQADVAMYVAKRSGAGYGIYDAARDEHSPQRLALVTELRAALETGSLTLAYQPLVTLGDGEGRLRGVEALLRWDRPHDPAPPERFLPLAESTGLAVPLIHWVLQQVGQAYQAWRRDGLSPGISINLSARVLHDPALPEIVAAFLGRYGVAPRDLTLEMTESTLAADPARAQRALSGLAALGTRLSIDEFGTGYSSIVGLRDLPIHEVKIDRRFVAGLGQAGDGKNLAIVRSVIALARALSLGVVAEGVETREARAALSSLGCQVAQGAAVSPPLAPGDLRRWAGCAAGDGVLVP